jgi:hypothetical protein
MGLLIAGLVIGGAAFAAKKSSCFRREVMKVKEECLRVKADVQERLEATRKAEAIAPKPAEAPSKEE